MQFHYSVDLYESDSLSGRLRELENKLKENSSWVIPKVVVVTYGSGCLRELCIKEFE